MSEQSNLVAYHGDPAVKARYLARVRMHRAQDELVQGYGYWKDGKGCAVGCTVHGADHYAYETELGIPVFLARIEDGLFESLPTEEARAWPEAFLEAIPVGANLYVAYWQFMVWLLIDPEEGVIKFAKKDATREAIQPNSYGTLRPRRPRRKIEARPLRAVPRYISDAIPLTPASDKGFGPLAPSDIVEASPT